MTLLIEVRHVTYEPQQVLEIPETCPHCNGRLYDLDGDDGPMIRFHGSGNVGLYLEDISEQGWAQTMTDNLPDGYDIHSVECLHCDGEIWNGYAFSDTTTPARVGG